MDGVCGWLTVPLCVAVRSIAMKDLTVGLRQDSKKLGKFLDWRNKVN